MHHVRTLSRSWATGKRNLTLERFISASMPPRDNISTGTPQNYFWGPAILRKYAECCTTKPEVKMQDGGHAEAEIFVSLLEDVAAILDYFPLPFFAEWFS